MTQIPDMLFQGWTGILRVLIVGTLAYAGLLIFLRVSGKRTLAKLNAFDLVVSVALGSTLATILLSDSVALAEGMTAFALLIFLQWLVARLSVASHGFARTVRSEPRILMHNGEPCPRAMRAERVTEDELAQILRANGSTQPDDADTVILESDGSFSVIARDFTGHVRTARVGLPDEAR
ncbi:DUF421 domain-containing protein [Citreimonas salinaria]|uniref:DUF421 domain-containing protein n=1 Tax=Citreimonas salinaria TaxID=321339 RepID=A0A1H3JYM7_9RHOB|nr:YetF domain-containing protein [Citreimonas salinaria]SDY45070.1 Protein of unknown function [Citreimonas salinaria]